MRYLKYIRIAIAIFFLIATTTLFFDFSFLLSGNWDEIILGFQFVPSLLKFIRGVSFLALGFIFFTILSLFLGRWYCSFVCPLGILQDIFIRLNKFLFKKKRIRYSYKNTLPWLKFVILGIAIIMLVLGFSIVFILLDPYSNFGRIVTHIFQPIYLFINNITAFVVNKLGYYDIYHIDLDAFDLASFVFAMLVVVVLLWLTHKRGRLFCNILCPVGALLSITSKISLFKLKVNETNCVLCGLCEKDCKAESIDYKKSKIDFDRCISCFNCVDTCNENAITYKFNPPSSFKYFKKKPKDGGTHLVNFVENKKSPQKVISNNIDASKRNTIKTVLVGFVGVLGLSFKVDDDQLSSFKSKLPAKSLFPVLPPGAISLNHYKETCTACHLCVSACPSNVIQSTFVDFGVSGMFIPKMDFDVNYCQFKCNLCTQICPTGALKPFELEEKKVIQIGKVVFIKDNCVVTELEKNCGACAEHCPTTAVKMIPYKNNLFIPEVNTDICIGCGACEHPCPVRPHKAIYVESNLSHAVAQKPKIEIIEQKEDIEEDFPF